MTQIELTAGAREGAHEGAPDHVGPHRPGPALQARRPPLRRSRRDRIISGVAGGVAEHLGFDPLAVRIAFVGLAFTGFGIVAYLLLWALAPLEPVQATSPDAAAAAGWRPVAQFRRPAARQLLGAGLLIVGVFAVLGFLDVSFEPTFFIPVILAALGFAVLWARGSADEGRARLDLASIGSPAQALLKGNVSLGRLLFGGLLIFGGIAVFLAATTSITAAANVILAVIVTAGGLALLAGPWLWRLANEVIEERGTRIRTQARAEMAAHLHDSVLQTLALIQRSKEPREMASLARTQERDLRAWLYGRAPSVHGVRLRDAIDSMAGKLERDYQVKVEAVVVGDVEMDDELRALVGATNEAAMNAAKHAGVEDVAVYVEVEEDRVAAYIRDAGAGFDPAAVPEDRRGIADSIVARMARHGGTAEVRSRPGGGTEIRLSLPRNGAPS
jgi:signal transduction histidine kinase